MKDFELKTNDTIVTKMDGFSTNGFYFDKGIEFNVVVMKDLLVISKKFAILRNIVPGIGINILITLEEYKTWFIKKD